MKIIIIGKGPAGISASLYTKRANIDTIVIGKDFGSLQKADMIENFYGFKEPVKASELVSDSIENAKRLGVQVVDDEVTGIQFNGKYLVSTALQNEYKADALILATGAARNTPKIEGVQKFEGAGVSYCAVCDAFFYRKKNVCVLGNASYALHEALTLLPVAEAVTILTDGKELEIEVPESIAVNTEKIARLNGDTKLNSVEFENGTSLETSGLFVALGVASSADLARKLGAEVKDNKIVVDSNMGTNLPGLYAAGDCVGGLLQICKAISDGAIAATSAIKFLRQK